MARFQTTLCLNGVRTSDGVPLYVKGSRTLHLSGALVPVDAVVERALPSRIATVMVSAMAEAPDYSFSVLSLLGSRVHSGHLGDVVVGYLIRDQMWHHSALYERQGAQRSVVTDPDQHINETVHAALQFEECLLFAHDNGAVSCETLRGDDSAETVDEVLRALRVISLVIFRYTRNRVIAVLVETHLSTAHMAALLMASRRHVFLYADETASAEAMLATATELHRVRQSLCAFATPRDVEDFSTEGAASQRGGGVAPFEASPILDAIAHTEGESSLLCAAMAREFAIHAQRHHFGSGEVEKREAAMRLELRDARAAQQAAEVELENQRRLHRKEILSLRAELEKAVRSTLEMTETMSEGRPVSHDLLQSFQQPWSMGRTGTPTRATEANQRKAQKFEAEKARLLEVREELISKSFNEAALGHTVNGSFVVRSPRPSLRLSHASAVPVRAPPPPSPSHSPWEVALLRQENAALVTEFQRKEKEWQLRLRQASAEVVQLQNEKAAMKATLQLQSQTIAAAQKALLDQRATHEHEMADALQRVRSLSMVSLSCQRSCTGSVPAGRSRSDEAICKECDDVGQPTTVSAASGIPKGAPHI